MQKVERIADLGFGTGLGSAKTSSVSEALADTTTWDEIIQILEGEALRKFALAE